MIIYINKLLSLVNYIYFIFLYIFFNYLNIFHCFKDNYIQRQKNILGFNVCGVGNGHLTQAKTIYDIIINYYEIPIVIIYGRDKGYDKVFFKSKVIYKKIGVSAENFNNMNIWDYLKAIKFIIEIKPTKIYEKDFLITRWFNFMICDLFNYRTKQLLIANHLTVPDIRFKIASVLIKLLSNVIGISIHLPSPYTNYVIPPLISTDKIEREYTDKKLIIAYSVSGNDFPNTLIDIANYNPFYKIKYFTNTKINTILPINIELYEPDEINFSKYLKQCSAVLCTSGNQLILESTYNKIPVAIMPCSKNQFEQVYNIKKYIDILKYAILMNPELDLDLLVKRNMEEYEVKMINELYNRKEKLLNLCNI